MHGLSEYVTWYAKFAQLGVMSKQISPRLLQDIGKELYDLRRRTACRENQRNDR